MCNANEIMAEICVETIMKIDFRTAGQSSMWQNLNLVRVVFLSVVLLISTDNSIQLKLLCSSAA